MAQGYFKVSHPLRRLFFRMSLRDSITLRSQAFRSRRKVRASLYARHLMVAALLFFLTVALPAKEVPVTAIALYDGPSGPAYIQITGLLLNGKTELRVCDGVSKIDKRTYDTLPRTQLTGATTLERGAD